MCLHSKYTDYKIIYKNKQFEKLEHITDSNRTINIYYYLSGQIIEEWRYLNTRYHRENGPAWIWYYESGQIQTKKCFLNGLFHCEEGPAVIQYNKSGNIIEYKFYY